MVQPSRTPAGAGNGLSDGGMRIGSGGGADDWIPLKEAAALLGVAPRTAFDYRAQGKLRCVEERHGKKVHYRTTRAWVEELRLTRERWKGAGAQEDPPAGPAATQAPRVAQEADEPSEWAPLAVARFILGEDADEAALVHFSEEVKTYRRTMPLLQPETRLLLVREYFSRVKRSVRHLSQVADGGPGLVAAALTLTLCSLAAGALAAVGG